MRVAIAIFFLLGVASRLVDTLKLLGEQLL